MKTLQKISRWLLSAVLVLGTLGLPQVASATAFATNYGSLTIGCISGPQNGLVVPQTALNFAGCTITVYNHGTSTLAGVYAAATGTALTNPIVLTLGTGTVTTTGTTVTGVTGTSFPTTGSWVGQTINIAGVAYTIASVTNGTTLTTVQTLATIASATAYTVSPQTEQIFAADGQYDICVANSTSVPVLQGGCNYGLAIATNNYSQNKASILTDFTDGSGGTSLQAITGLSFVIPATQTAPVNFHCALAYSQATGAVSDAFGIAMLTTAPTRIDATGTVFTSQTVTTTSGVAQNMANLTSTTPTAIATFTPGASATIYNAYLDGVVQPAGGGAQTIQFYESQATAANVITVKAGSYCTAF